MLLGMFPHGAIQLTFADMRRDGSDHAHGNAVLQIEQIRQLAVQPIGPDQMARLRFIQLHRNSNQVAGAP